MGYKSRGHCADQLWSWTDVITSVHKMAPHMQQPFELEWTMKYAPVNLCVSEATACCPSHRVTLTMLRFLCYNYHWTQLRAYHHASMCHGPVETWTPTRKNHRSQMYFSIISNKLLLDLSSKEMSSQGMPD